jgi:hypothetical protein
MKRAAEEDKGRARGAGISPNPCDVSSYPE